MSDEYIIQSNVTGDGRSITEAWCFIGQRRKWWQFWKQKVVVKWIKFERGSDPTPHP